MNPKYWASLRGWRGGGKGQCWSPSTKTQLQEESSGDPMRSTVVTVDNILLKTQKLYYGANHFAI